MNQLHLKNHYCSKINLYVNPFHKFDTSKLSFLISEIENKLYDSY